MGMDMGEMTWNRKLLDYPITWQTAHERKGFDFTQITPEQGKLIQSRFHNWYTADWDFALTTVYFFCAAIGVAALFRWGSWALHRRSAVPRSRASAFDRLVAILSYTTSRVWRFKVFGNYYTPPLAAIIAIGAMFIWVMALMLGPKPFYYPNPVMGHSPPIATRTGWMSIGIMPFMIAFASKTNYVALLTRTSHERLQVFHRWSALLMYMTSLVHTFPFIVRDINEGMMEMNWATDRFYWTGVAALVPQTWLLAMSWGFIRNRYYEFFKKMHFIAASIFMAALFCHVNFFLTSWHYFWATLALYGTVWVYRVVRATLTPGTAIVSVLEDRTLHIRIAVPNSFRWAAGQHVFVRFLFGPLHWASSHPFTIANVPAVGEPNGAGLQQIELVLRARYGITKALEKAAAKGKTCISVFVDGPYGHVGLASDLRRFDRVLFLAGGSGASFTIPLLIDLERNRSSRPADATTRFVVAVREGGAFTWLERQMKPLNDLETIGVAQSTHVTRQKVEEIDPEKGDSKSDDNFGSLQNGRPNIYELVRELCEEPGRVAVVACGPDEFAHDVRSAVAAEQLSLALGRGVASEVFLHVENYSW
ncbi:FAD-binding domain-containing protein [Favolaschia claudopus]|uniref:ferric-chelate reductase (NADPH) n=1 Tax=Favolaschia claudopus TaxID=2862362 RepID=A0AAW0CWZ1_9AGAR